jgi:hypothetical protein
MTEHGWAEGWSDTTEETIAIPHADHEAWSCASREPDPARE